MTTIAMKHAGNSIGYSTQEQTPQEQKNNIDDVLDIYLPVIKKLDDGNIYNQLKQLSQLISSRSNRLEINNIIEVSSAYEKISNFYNNMVDKHKIVEYDTYSMKSI
jgi:hypothetical protein